MFDSTKKQLDLDALTEYHRQLVSIINTSNSGNQVSTMPTASATWNGKVVQYVGTTDANYIKGYFYECVNNNGTYSWVQTDVQEGSGSGSGVVYDDKERVIGTWFGKPLYQKAYTGLNIALLDNSGVGTQIILSDVSVVVSVQGIGSSSGARSKTIPLTGYISTNNNELGVFCGFLGGTTINTLILQYTKTTD